jgi:superfamily II DNA or RNA helicase
MRRERNFNLIVVPTTALRFQWAEAAAEYGIDLDPCFENGDKRPGRERDGVVVTYSAVASLPAVYRKLCADQRTFAVLDEVHHCGDDLSWGQGIRHALDPAGRRLLLSGTPFRKGNSAIPFVNYELDEVTGKLTSRPDYRYDYGDALRDGVVRAVEFCFYDSTARWVGAGEITSRELSAINRGDEGRALSSALIPESDWLSAVLPEAHRYVQRARKDIPDAAGLIIANDQGHAVSLARAMSAVVEHEVPAAISDDPRAREIIERFAKSKAPWLVAVKMVSEGVDIPRLITEVYATRTRTDLYFRQATGRVVRTRGDESDSYAAAVFMPSIPRFIEYARELESERDHVLAGDIEPPSRERDPDETPPHLYEALAAIDGRYHGSILSGDQISDAEYQRANEIIERHGLSWNVAQLAVVLREAVAATSPLATTPGRSPIAPYRERGQLKAKLNTLVNRYADRVGERHSVVWSTLHNLVGEKNIREATVESLEKRIILISGWLEQM